MPESARLVTAEELERFPSDDRRYELVDGRLVRMSPVNFDHGRIVMQLGALLHLHLKGQPSGVVVADVGFKLASNPDTVRGPDIAFLLKDRVPSPGGRGFYKGHPDLVIEVLSPEDRPGRCGSKSKAISPVASLSSPSSILTTGQRRSTGQVQPPSHSDLKPMCST